MPDVNPAPEYFSPIEDSAETGPKPRNHERNKNILTIMIYNGRLWET